MTNETGWIPVDPLTLTTSFESVYAVGDVTTITLPGRFSPDKALVLPKAGIFAHKQAEVLAHNLVVEITGLGEPRSYDGFGGCFIELGDGRAGYGEGNFYAPQAPAIALRQPTRRWHWAKVLLEKYWLWRWITRGPAWAQSIGDRLFFG